MEVGNARASERGSGEKDGSELKMPARVWSTGEAFVVKTKKKGLEGEPTHQKAKQLL